MTRLDNPLVVPELSKFNVELNGTPQPLTGRALQRLETGTDRALGATAWQVAHELEGTLVMIGILPTVREQDLTLANISPLNRYYALNDQVLQVARAGGRIRLDISGREHLRLTHDDVMLEAATTSFQVHLQAPADEAVRYYNAAQILSAPWWRWRPIRRSCSRSSSGTRPASRCSSRPSDWRRSAHRRDAARDLRFRLPAGQRRSSATARTSTAIRCCCRSSSRTGRTATAPPAPAQRHHLALESDADRLRRSSHAAPARGAPRDACRARASWT